MIYTYKNFKSLKKVYEGIKVSANVDRESLAKIRRSFTQIITNLPFFAELLFNLDIYELKKEDCDTACTDGKSIGYYPGFIKKLSMSQVNFVVLHEIMHNANFHFTRRGDKDPRIWNYAADYAINLLLNDMAKERSNIIKAPKEILLDEKYRNMGAEQIYNLLTKDSKNKTGKGQGKPSDGKGQGKPSDGKGQGKPSDGKGQGKPSDGKGQGGGELPPDDIKSPGSIGKMGGEEIYKGSEGQGSDEKSLEKKWREIVQKAASKGTGSASMDRWLKKATNPKVNWKRELKKFVNEIYNKYDYGYFNKKFIHSGDYWPGLKRQENSKFSDVVIAIDTSGSITDETLGKFGAELYQLFKAYQITRCHVVWCDSEINSVQTFSEIDSSFKLNKLQPKGGGGTSFYPPFKWIKENLLKKGKNPGFVLYFTDAYGDAPPDNEFGIKSYKNRVMWIITDNDNASHIKFGKKLYIDKINP